MTTHKEKQEEIYGNERIVIRAIPHDQYVRVSDYIVGLDQHAQKHSDTHKVRPLAILGLGGLLDLNGNMSPDDSPWYGPFEIGVSNYDSEDAINGRREALIGLAKILHPEKNKGRKK